MNNFKTVLAQIDLKGLAPSNPALTSIGGLFSQILNVAIPLIGMIFVGVLIFGGYSYIMAQGDPGKVKTAQGVISNAVIGLIIVLMAFVIRNIIFTAITGSAAR